MKFIPSIFQLKKVITNEVNFKMLPKNPNKHLLFDQANIREIYVAGGCFWGIDAYLARVIGVYETESGYANGGVENPTYERVCTDTTGFVEVVLVRYDVTKITLKALLEEFTTTIDPISLSGKVAAVGTQYRSGIYYTFDADLPIINEVVNELRSKSERPVGIEVGLLENYYPAEDYHQDYLEKNPDGHCHVKFN